MEFPNFPLVSYYTFCIFRKQFPVSFVFLIFTFAYGPIMCSCALSRLCDPSFPFAPVRHIVRRLRGIVESVCSAMAQWRGSFSVYPLRGAYVLYIAMGVIAFLLCSVAAIILWYILCIVFMNGFCVWVYYGRYSSLA